MNHKTGSSLFEICSRCAEWPAFAARLTESKAEESVNAYLDGKTGVQFDLDITLIGSEQILDYIGGKLSDHRLFLQKPYHIPWGTEYRNPQYLYLADLFEGEDQDTSLTQKDEDNVSTNLVTHFESGDPHSEVYNIFDSSLQHGKFESVEITRSVCAQLMR